MGGVSRVDFGSEFRTLETERFLTDTIIIRGKGIVRLLDALNIGSLETVRENSGVIVSALENAIAV
jgi:hypothetical protein